MLRVKDTNGGIVSVTSVWVMDVLKEKFPGIYGGHASCRPISGTAKPSQHAYPNARDLTLEAYGYSTDPVNQAFLDGVYEFLKENFDKLSLRLIIWRGRAYPSGNQVSGHFNHIHIDFWPTGYPQPPCLGGKLRYQFSNGRVVYGDPGPENGITEVNDPRPTPPPLDKGDYEMPTLELWDGYKSKGKGHLRQSVRALQIMLAGAGHADQMSADKTCAADGWFGQGTDAAVRSFQRDYALVADGKCGRLTWAALVAATT